MINVAKMDEMMADMESGIYDLTKGGECSQCGGCCSNYLALSDTEIGRIKEYIKENAVVQQKHEMNFLAKRPDIDMLCPFLNTNKDAEKCEIYPVRPDNCKYFICNPGKRREMQADFARCGLGGKRPVDMRNTFF